MLTISFICYKLIKLITFTLFISNVKSNNNIVEPKCLSIKEIQKLTAQSNYHFTVVNMVQ